MVLILFLDGLELVRDDGAHTQTVIILESTLRFNPLFIKDPSKTNKRGWETQKADHGIGGR